MPGKPIGTIFAELSLDSTPFDKGLAGIKQAASVVVFDVEKNFKNLGISSAKYFELSRAKIENSYQGILHSATSSASDIVHAEEAKNAKIKALNEQQFGAQTSFLDSLKSHWIAISASVYAAWSLIQKGMQYVELGAKVKSIEDSFTLMAKNSGIAIEGLISNLKRVTAETIDDSDLMKKATRLISEGFSPGQIITIGAAARTAARLMGTDVSQAYEQIADSIVNLRTRGLKTAGFIIDMDEAERKHALTLGITKDQLNDYGKQMAWVNAIKEKNLELTDKLKISQGTEYENLQKLNAQWNEFKESIGGLALRAWSEAWAEIRAQILALYSPIIFVADKITMIADAYARIRGRSTSGERIAQGQYEIQDIENGPGISVYKNQIKGLTDAELKKIKDRLEETILSANKLRAEAELLSNAGKMPDWREWIEELPKGIATIGGISYKLSDLYKRTEEENRVAGELAQTMADDMFPALEKVNAMIDQGNKYWIDQNKQLAISQSLIKEMDWESVASGLTTLSSDTERAITQTTIAIEKQVDSLHKTEDVIKSISQSISDVWSTNMSRMIMDSKNAKEALSNIWKGMADVFVSTIMKMITNLILFQNVQGNYSSGQGLMGWLGGIFKTSPVISEQHGTDYIPHTGIYQLHQGEAVIPVEKNKRGYGDVFVNVVNNAPNTKATTKESQDGRGNRSIEVIIDEAVAQQINRTGSASNKAIRGMGGQDTLIHR